MRAILAVTLISISIWVFGSGVDAQGDPASPQDQELLRAINAYVDGDYLQARRLFEPLAEAGRSEAQYFLGYMYERGYEVGRDAIVAQSWYLRASQLGNRKAREAAIKLAKRLNPDQSREADRLAEDDRLVLDKDRGCVSFFGEPLVSHYITTFQPHSSVEGMVSDILGFTGLAQNFTIQAANVPNAAAVIQGTERYLLYNPQFIQQVNHHSGTEWAAYSVMAHEIGHHLQGHTIQPGGSRPPIELEADQFSGFILANMGADLSEAQAAMASMASASRTSTHPARDERLTAIERGWSSARQKGGKPSGSARRRRPSVPDVQRSPLPAPPNWVIARSCATPLGECPMQIPATVGAVCYCVSPYGYVPGYAR